MFRNFQHALIRTGRPHSYTLRQCRLSSDSDVATNWRKFIGLAEPVEGAQAKRILVPTRYLPTNSFIPSPQVVADLKWLMQKIKLRQDIFLIGPPSRYRSQLVLMMLELLDLEYEYIMLNRDTSESDLKQRKELMTSAMSSVYVDQCVVRAAAHGRVLILDGVEKAERNLLPIINNLVENREMQLEDGRFMLPADRYKRLAVASKTDSGEIPLLPVHGDFRVVAIGLPTPPFRGHNLDPPFRSRFQSRRVGHWPLRDQFLIAGSAAPSMDQDRLARWLSFTNAMASDEIQRKPSQVETIHVADEGQAANSSDVKRKAVLNTPPPYFPVDTCLSAATILNNCPLLSGKEMIELVYPTKLLDAVYPGCSDLTKQLAKKFDLWEDMHKDKEGISSLVSSLDVKPSGVEDFAEVKLVLPSKDSSFLVPAGDGPLKAISSDFVETPATRKTLLNMLLAHSVSDFCVVGNRGSGKTANISQFARLLGYGDKLTTVMLYQDMTGRDLLQQRVTRADGSTSWEFSPVVRAALNGGLLVLDGIHVVNSSTLLVLKRLIEDREVFLPDGSRGLRYDRYDALKASRNFTDEQMKAANIFRIHPAFRLIAVGEPPTASKNASTSTTPLPATSTSSSNSKSTSSKTSSSSLPLPSSSSGKQTAPGPWLTPDVNGMFLFVTLPPPTAAEESKILEKLCPNMTDTVQKLVKLSDAGANQAGLLSLRQKLRLLRFLHAYPSHSLHDAITSAALHRFMSLPARIALSEALANAGVKSQLETSSAATIKIDANKLTVGDISTEIYSMSEVDGKSVTDNVDEAMRIPSVLFYDNHRQVASMALMLKALLIGEHLLVIGNQGVGKNRIVDRLLELWSRPRHYAQLHRDSTVQSLTSTPSVSGGRLRYEDSPLVKAVRAGHILVLDEVDKAPVHVTRVLKGLVESGHMLLPDGRRISAAAAESSADVIRLHPDFRMIVLANPPGYPFLGNNFFASLGDLFSCHIVDNPDFESELELVKNYAGPDFDNDLLRRLTASFAELRSKANDGLLPYPYSTRELINVVKHLAMFPKDNVSDALRNVFDFDAWNDSALDAATTAFGKFGIAVERPTSTNEVKQQLARLVELPVPSKLGSLTPTNVNKPPKIELVSSTSLKFDGPRRVETHKIAVDQSDGRLSTFSELTRCFSLDLPDHCTVHEAAVTHHKTIGADILHLYTTNPALLISFPMRYDTRNGSMIMLDRLLHSPYLRLFPFEESTETEGSNLLLFDSRSGFASTLNTQTGRMFTYSNSFAPMKPVSPTSDNSRAAWQHAGWVPSNLAAERPYAVAFRPGEHNIGVVDFVAGKFSTLKLPFAVKTVSPAWSKEAAWLITGENPKDKNGAVGVLNLSTSPSSPFTASFQAYDASVQLEGVLNDMKGVAAVDDQRRVCIPVPGKLNENVYSVFVGGNAPVPSPITVVGVERSDSMYKLDDKAEASEREVRDFLSGDKSNIEVNDSVYLPANSLLVSSLSSKRRYSVGSLRSLPLASTSNVDSVIEVVHVPPSNHNTPATVSHVPILSASSAGIGGTDSSKGNLVRLLPLSSQDVAAVMSNGLVRVWEVVQGRIQTSLSAWQHRLGLQQSAEPDKMELTISQLLRQKLAERNRPPPEFNGPKHGKVDPNNAPHVGGNQWQGGSGGRDTAGMGGAGGPYRLDSGNPITQVPDWVKDSVPEHIKKAAREVAQRTYAERLKQIKMSPFDAQLYERFALRVRREVALLRNIIESLPSSKHERIWLRNQSDGDLDETRLIEGLTGEKSVYKRRVDPQSDDDRDSSEDKPRLLSLVVDVSGSMARFNSVDMRLERELAATLMVMESLASQGEQRRIIYDIYGHSGDTDSLELVRADNPPTNAKQRLDVLQSMQAHTMFCSSGDSTISAVSQCLARIKRLHADRTSEKFVILLSDANLSRYGIPASKLAEAMVPKDLPQDTRVFAIMLGSLGSQADSLVQELPVGQGYVCMDTAMLPRILQQILTTTLLMQD